MNPRGGLDQFAGLLGTILQLFGDILPVSSNFGIRVLFHGCAHELEGNVFGKADQAVGVHKTAIELDKVLVPVRKQTGTHVGNENKVEGIGLADFREFLEASEISGVVVEVFCEFVPDEDNGLQVVGLDDALDPVCQILCGHAEGLDLALSRKFEDLIHQSVERRTVVGFQLRYDIVHGVPTEKVRIAALYIDTKALLVFFVFKVSDHRILQRVRPLVFHAGLSESLINTLLNGKNQVLISVNAGGSVAVDGQHFSTVLDPL